MSAGLYTSRQSDAVSGVRSLLSRINEWNSRSLGAHHRLDELGQLLLDDVDVGAHGAQAVEDDDNGGGDLAGEAQRAVRESLVRLEPDELAHVEQHVDGVARQEGGHAQQAAVREQRRRFIAFSSSAGLISVLTTTSQEILT